MESLCGCRIPDGHPLFILYKENDALSKKIASLRDALLFEEFDRLDEALEDVLRVSFHYAKKDVLYPLAEEGELAAEMKARDEYILRELGYLAVDEALPEEAWDERLRNLLSAMRDMLSRENNVLFPHLSQTLSEAQWIQVYFAFRGIEPCHIGAYPVWPRAEHPDAPRCACEL